MLTIRVNAFEPELARSLRVITRLRKNRPRARARIRNAEEELKTVLSHWELAYNKESFYRGIRVLLELQRNGSSKL